MKVPTQRYARSTHGRSDYYIVGEGVINGDRVEPACGREPNTIDSNTDTARAFKFTRMLPRSNVRFDPEQLKELGNAMHADSSASPDQDSAIPAGFTYFGQFVDHDITFDRSAGIPSELVDPDVLTQGRSPALDLDSLYGNGPEGSPELYEPDRVRLRVGTTTPLSSGRFPGADIRLPNDLPRLEGRVAIIGDPRNDENLAVAQMHLAFIKFHNRVVESIARDRPHLAPAFLFEAARASVVRHYQWIVLNDFLPRLCDRDVLVGLIGDARAMVGASAMPVEFSAAAYRLGHSMIRPVYEWNRFFNSDAGKNGRPGIGIATLLNLFQFTGDGGFSPNTIPNQPLPDGLQPTLPSNWVANCNLLFDFSEVGGIRDQKMNLARAINTGLADPLKNIPGVVDPDGSSGAKRPASLASRNLRRGAFLSLPTGQEAAAYFGLAPMAPAKIADGPNHALNQIVSKYGYHERTPLWFYVLKEAESRHYGQSLGIVGSLIVAGTFVSLIKGSRVSILRETAWSPDLPGSVTGDFRMTDLLKFVDDLNPLGN